ncbi:MAG: YihY family inner membrane protein [Verrucomicrobia bacterium]|jgi:membrane protein|nr:YihY family inner membrane protein [Verrucomicrobiota bacterium]OQC27076.1 MAG: hypothetical protein BWX68_00271 [Verrucomicrobia bacterium ADurb.Bin063]HNW06399.1 YhjD/YihY/BrkB family envelope integrity protein [Verrucomicrobiota bacterium]HNZ74733.1 YhjD/YihY/BrkB family envelope integrity protein [Verrucomicrobiota bacterium]HOC49595.1 YhjD/YihY/BrkB family envelope integrity protein [Verrucomicrobiota bacterium]
MARKASRFRQICEDARALLDERAPRALTDFSKWQRFAHFWILVGRSFVRNRCPVRASALSYVTVLALIPMLAVVMSISSALLKQEGEEQIDRFIDQFVTRIVPPATFHTNRESASPQALNPPAATNLAVVAPDGSPPAVNSLVPADRGGETNSSLLPSLIQDDRAVKARRAVARNIHDFIQNTRSGTLGITGSILLIFMAISMLSRIEDTFNDIWGVARGRSWFTRIVLYWGVITLVPLLLIVALGLATGPHLAGTREFLTAMPVVSKLTFQFLPVVVLCLSFTLFYALMPNTRVRWPAALAGGLTGGLLFHLNNLISVLYVSRMVTTSKIYGSLGLVPVFMIGMYFSWLILLFGGQVAYAWQNRATYLDERQAENINQRGREFVALRLMTCIGERFTQGAPPPNALEIAEGLAVPTRLVKRITQTLAAARLVTETAGAEPAYLPARPLDQITCHDVLLAMRASQGQECATRDEPARAEVYGEFHRIGEAERQAATAVSLQALVNRAQRLKQLPGPARPAAGE